jgi:alpha-1,4-digalacturonate transport system permease protein
MQRVPRWIPWAFLLPNLAIIALFSLAPVAINVLYSVTGSDNLYPSDAVRGARRTLLDCEASTRPLLARSILARALQRDGLLPARSSMIGVALRRRSRSTATSPPAASSRRLLLPGDVVARGGGDDWVWLLQRDGAVNGILGSLGFLKVSWLSDPARACRWSVFVTVWAHMGFYMVILLAGLQSIPADLYEAAKMDRASPWRVFSRITLPLLKPVLLVVFVLATIRSVQTFDEIYVLTGGGPGTATKMIVHYIYDTGFAVMPRNYGLAAAASLMLGRVLFMFTALQMRLSRGARDG